MVAVKQSRTSKLLDKLSAALVAAGMSRKKAGAVAKELVPVARRAVKSEITAKAKAEAKPPAKVKLGKAVKENGEPDEEKILDESKAPKVNGKFRLRLDLPILSKMGDQKASVLRVMDGLSSSRTYIVAAVKGEKGIVAVRKLYYGPGLDFNVKFYPDFKEWGVDHEQLKSLGAREYCKRQWYERYHMPQAGLDQLLARLEAEAKSKSRVKNILDRIKAISFQPLFKAFEYLTTSRYPN